MRFAQLNEEPSIVDQIIGDFEAPLDSAPRPEKIQTLPATSRDPVKIQGIDHNTFSQWLRSKEQVRHAIQEKLETPKMSLKNCIALYTEYNIKIDDFVILEFPIKAVFPYREYDRDIKDGSYTGRPGGWTGSKTSEEYTDMMKDIQKHGIKEPGIMDIIDLKGGMYAIQLAEGNHRLRIAGQLGMDKMPIRFSYGFG